MAEDNGGQAGTIIDKLRTLIRELAILIAAISALLAAWQSYRHTGTLGTIVTNQAEVKTETAQNQVIAAKNLVNTTGAPEDKKTLVEAEKKLAETQQAK